MKSEEDRKKVYEDLCKDKCYPCQYCKRQTDVLTCTDKCEKWIIWFKHTWRNIRKEVRDILDKIQEENV